jgi:hypothetical protein
MYVPLFLFSAKEQVQNSVANMACGMLLALAGLVVMAEAGRCYKLYFS